MNLEINQKTYKEIEEAIHSDTSPVGIDAKKTHILILQKLEELSNRLEKLEKEMNKK